uniref:Uncharacterized protein n=1 Tax=Oryza barthii TaxID=65489 RepID=A0A0D3EU93_9ORYZ
MNSGAPDQDTPYLEVVAPAIPSLGAPDPAVLALATPVRSVLEVESKRRMSPSTPSSRLAYK